MSESSSGDNSESERPQEYLSKSRLKTWVSCPRKFRFKYVEGRDEPTTKALERGTAIHELIESYYENVQDYVDENGDVPDSLYSMLPSDKREDWRQYLDPYLSHFLGFERRRLEQTDGTLEDWIPRAVEAEKWKSAFEETPTLMGYADVMLPAASFDKSTVPEDNGVVLVDHKTGEPKSKRYRDHENGGVNLDLGYYALLFESDYNIVSVGAYYPKTDDFYTTDIQTERRQFIQEVAEDIADADPETIEDYPLNMTPLCAWGEGDGERCPFYDECPSTWAVPVDNTDETIELIRDGYEDDEIAEEMGTTEDAVSYWVRKKRWYRFRD